MGGLNPVWVEASVFVQHLRKQRVLLWWRHLVRVHVSEKLAVERLLGCTPSAGVQVQHVVEKVQGRRRDAGEDTTGQRDAAGTDTHAEKAQTHKANSSLRRLRYCFFGFMVWKKGSLITSGQTAGQGLPQIRLRDTSAWV